LDPPLLRHVLGSAKQDPHSLGGIRRKIFRWAHKKAFWGIPRRHGYYILESEMVLVGLPDCRNEGDLTVKIDREGLDYAFSTLGAVLT
jgi:hypothetical protein